MKIIIEIKSITIMFDSEIETCEAETSQSRLNDFPERPSKGFVESIRKNPIQQDFEFRSDKGNSHHCSNCGSAGRRALSRLNGRCLSCVHWGSW